MTRGDSKGIVGKKIPQIHPTCIKRQGLDRKESCKSVKVTLFLQAVGNAGLGGVTVGGCQGLAQVLSVFHVGPQ